MATIMKRLLHFRPISHSFTRPYPYTRHHFSSDSDHGDASKPQTPPSQTPPPPSNYEFLLKIYDEKHPEFKEQLLNIYDEKNHPEKRAKLLKIYNAEYPELNEKNRKSKYQSSGEKYISLMDRFKSKSE